jgi:hypothetical protein
MKRSFSLKQRKLIERLYFAYYNPHLIHIPIFKFYENLNLSNKQKYELNKLKAQSIHDITELVTKITSLSLSNPPQSKTINGARNINREIFLEEQYNIKKKMLVEKIYRILHKTQKENLNQIIYDSKSMLRDMGVLSFPESCP